MACVNADGTISGSAKELLNLISSPHADEEIAVKLNRPLFKVRSSLRELEGAGFAIKSGYKFSITEKGKEKLK